MNITILGLIRHILTFAGGIFASKGYIDGSEVEGVVGAVVTLVGVVWSALAKSDKFPSIK